MENTLSVTLNEGYYNDNFQCVITCHNNSNNSIKINPIIGLGKTGEKEGIHVYNPQWLGRYLFQLNPIELEKHKTTLAIIDLNEVKDAFKKLYPETDEIGIECSISAISGESYKNQKPLTLNLNVK